MTCSVGPAGDQIVQERPSPDFFCQQLEPDNCFTNSDRVLMNFVDQKLDCRKDLIWHRRDADRQELDDTLYSISELLGVCCAVQHRKLCFK